MDNLINNVAKSLAGAAAALVVTWVMSWGMVISTKHVRADAPLSTVVAAIRH